jgi:hypothetical protein
LLELNKNERTAANGPSHEELVRHLVFCIEEQGLEMEAADLYGHTKPKPVKMGLRPGRSRPDVVAKDGRRTVFGVGLLPSEIGAAYLPEKLATLAQKCRLLVICVSEDAAQQALDMLFNREQLAHRPKMRLLRHPLGKWEDPPKTMGPKTHYGPDFAPVVVRK